MAGGGDEAPGGKRPGVKTTFGEPEQPRPKGRSATVFALNKLCPCTGCTMLHGMWFDRVRVREGGWGGS